MKNRIPAILLLLTFIGAPGTLAPSALAADTQGAKTFVQNFYDWYAVKQAKLDKAIDLEKVLKLKANDFTADLTKKLKDDIAASSKSPDEIVGLDFDPIFSTNGDPYPKYVAGKITEKGGSILIDMHGVNHGKKNAKPDITPEVKQVKGKWQFANFHYGKSEFPENENLLSILKCLKESRDKPVK